jgi:hypothetical protein
MIRKICVKDERIIKEKGSTVDKGERWIVDENEIFHSA